MVMVTTLSSFYFTATKIIMQGLKSIGQSVTYEPSLIMKKFHNVFLNQCLMINGNSEIMSKSNDS